MHTEEEAKTKWCPFARVSNDGQGNRYPMDIDLASGHAFARCIASECMAWRWVEDTLKEVPAAGGYDQTEAPALEPIGYCGLAGKP